MTPVGHCVTPPADLREFSFSNPECSINAVCSTADLGGAPALLQSDTRKFVVLLPSTAPRDVHISHCAAFFRNLNYCVLAFTFRCRCGRAAT